MTRTCGLLACGFFATIQGTSQVADVNPGLDTEGPTILNRSPFIPPDWEPPQSSGRKAVPKTSSTGYEFRGVYQLGNEYRFLVSQPRQHNGKWVTAHTDYPDYEVRGYDPATETLTLFYNDKEESLKLEKMEANPTPMAVSGQVRKANDPGQEESTRPVRRTIRPSSRGTPGSTTRESGSAAPPPPAWLQKLREEAAQRRSQAGVGASGSGSSNIAPSGAPDRAQPDYTPPAPPEELLNMEIPPPPSGLPPAPPPEVMQKIQDSLYNPNPGT